MMPFLNDGLNNKGIFNMKLVLTLGFAIILFYSVVADAQLNSSTTMKKIDEIQNNTGTDILLNPDDKVDINYFTGDKALISTADGELDESATTSTELGYVSGVTSAIQTQLDGKQPNLPLITDGQLLYYNAGFAALNIGTAGQVLTVNGSLLPEWQDIIAVSVVNKGDLQTHDGVDPVALPVGLNGQLLSANSATSTGLEWIDPPATSPTVNSGDLIYNDGGGNASDTNLAIGSEGQILTVNSGLPSWQNPVPATTLSAKGDLQTHDGTSNATLNVGADGSFLIADSNETTGLRWDQSLQSTLNAVTDWQDGTCDDNWNGTAVTCKYRRVGDSAEIQYNMVVTSAPSGAGFGFLAPTGLVVDESKLELNATRNEIVIGNGYADDGTTVYNLGVTYLANPNLILPTWNFDDGTGDVVATSMTTVTPFTWQIGDVVNATVTVPIQGWSSGLDAVVANNLLDASSANEFSAVINSNGLIASENFDFINGDCTENGVSPFEITCTFNAGVFTETPVCALTSVDGSTSQNHNHKIVVVNSSTIAFTRYQNGDVLTGGTGTHIKCSKQGADVNKSQVIAGTFEQIENVNTELDATNDNYCSGTVGLAGTVITNENHNGCVTITKIGTGYYEFDYSAMGLSVTPKLFFNSFDIGAGIICGVDNTFSNTSTTGRVVCRNTSNVNTDTNLYYRIERGTDDYNKSIKGAVVQASSLAVECQTKILQATTGATGDIAQLTFNNLTIGKNYKHIIQANSASGVELRVLNGADIVSSLFASAGDQRRGTTGLFKSSATTVTVNKPSVGNLFGNGLRDQTFVTLCELPDNYILNSNKWD